MRCDGDDDIHYSFIFLLKKKKLLKFILELLWLLHYINLTTFFFVLHLYWIILNFVIEKFWIFFQFVCGFERKTFLDGVMDTTTTTTDTYWSIHMPFHTMMITSITTIDIFVKFRISYYNGFDNGKKHFLVCFFFEIYKHCTFQNHDHQNDWPSIFWLFLISFCHWDDKSIFCYFLFVKPGLMKRQIIIIIIIQLDG